MGKYKKTGNPMGRTVKQIDWSIVDNLLIAQCTGTEVAAHIGVAEDRLYDACVKDHGCSFTVYSTKKYAVGHALLRTKQLQKAVNGKCDSTMLIWLGKQYLGQKENPTNDQKFDGNLAKLLELLSSIDPKKASEPQKEPEKPESAS